jgi:hypothetical protein
MFEDMLEITFIRFCIALFKELMAEDNAEVALPES